MEGRCPLFGEERSSFCASCLVVGGEDSETMTEGCIQAISRAQPWETSEIKIILGRIISMGKTGTLSDKSKSKLGALLDSNIDLEEHRNYVTRLVGNAYAFLGHDKKAMESYEIAIHRDEGDATALNNKAVLLARTGKEDEAVECYLKVTKLDPGNENAWFNMGKAYSRVKKYRKAAKCFRKVVEVNPENVSAWNNLGVSLRSTGKPKEAIECYDSALKVNENYKWAWNNRGIAYMVMRKHKKAAQSFRKALEIDPNFAEAEEGLEACGEW
jgi:tetratricopeptide (TPR) repeat protein